MAENWEMYMYVFIVQEMWALGQLVNFLAAINRFDKAKSCFYSTLAIVSVIISVVFWSIVAATSNDFYCFCQAVRNLVREHLGLILDLVFTIVEIPCIWSLVLVSDRISNVNTACVLWGGCISIGMK